MLRNKLVYIIILNYNGYTDTIACLDSLAHCTYPNYRVVVVDNASSNDSEAQLLAYQECSEQEFTFIQSGANLGFAGGNNVGIRYALERGADYVWLLNNDTVIEPDALTRLMERIESDPDIGICGSRLMYYHDRSRVQGIGGWYSPLTGRTGHIIDEANLNQLRYIIGASMLVRAKVFREYGLLSEEYFLYCEEIDIAERIKINYRLAVATDSVVYHKEGASIGNLSAFAAHYSMRNTLRLCWKFYPYYLPTVLITTVLRIIAPWKKRPYNRLTMLYHVFKSFMLGRVHDL